MEFFVILYFDLFDIFQWHFLFVQYEHVFYNKSHFVFLVLEQLKKKERM